jgi:hypothetical protein
MHAALILIALSGQPWWQWERGIDWKLDDFPPHQTTKIADPRPGLSWNDPWEMWDRCQWWFRDRSFCARFVPS